MTFLSSHVPAAWDHHPLSPPVPDLQRHSTSIHSVTGTMIPKSGGDYAYISEAFGPLPAFLYLWVALLVIVPTGNAITALTFAQYILQPLWPACDPPPEAIRLLAAVITCELDSIIKNRCIVYRGSELICE